MWPLKGVDAADVRRATCQSLVRPSELSVCGRMRRCIPRCGKINGASVSVSSRGQFGVTT
jgi:hypothetical protein